ncbi:MAG: type I-A CRISPR-associated protein Cas5 [Thermoprotei archaeon]|nr:MAG: type I-A CRISPR-associated protein Cas5 [Thermoprotei archaeon]
MGLLAVRAVIEFHWGYSVKRPVFSAAQPAHIVPPPKPLLGAFARVIASVRRWPEAFIEEDALYSTAARLLDEILWAALALIDERFISPLLGLVETRDVIRALIAPYQRRNNIYPGSPFLFGIQPHGKVYAPSMRALATFLVRSEEAAYLAYALQCMGSRESIISVYEIEVGEARPLRQSEVETLYYFPARLGSVERGAFMRELLSAPNKDHYLLGRVHDVAANWEEYIVPLEPVSVAPSPRAAVVADPAGTPLIVPRDVVRL